MTKLNEGMALKRAAVIMVIIAILAQGLWISKLIIRIGETSQTKGDTPSSFGLIAYAKGMPQEIGSGVAEVCDAGAGAVEIGPDSEVSLPSGKLSRGTHYYIPAGEEDMELVYFANWEVGSFKCVGDGIAAVTFEAENGSFSQFNNITVSRDAGHSYVYTRNCVITEALCNRFLGMDYTEQVEFINAGGLDMYLGDDFRDRFPSVHAAIKSGSLSLWCGKVDGEGRPWFSDYFDEAGETRYEIQATYWEQGDEKNTAWEIGGSITIEPTGTANYCPPFSVFQAVTADRALDFSSFEADAITVTAEFENGDIVVKRVVVSFDAEGRLCAQLAEEKP